MVEYIAKENRQQPFRVTIVKAPTELFKDGFSVTILSKSNSPAGQVGITDE
jgi:hypothetical protein